jgi:uncharacterized membrane protein
MPAIAVTVAVLLALTSIGFLIYFIDHAARSVQAAVIIDSATEDTLARAASAYSRTGSSRTTVAADDAGGDRSARRGAAPWCTRSQPGYMQAIDRRSCATIAAEPAAVRLEVEIGEYLLPGQVIMSVWPASWDEGGAADELCDALVLGMERTPHQDVKHGIIELMDIAVKAMSPSINDPTTAVNSFQRIGEVLLDMAWREQGDDVERDDARHDRSSSCAGRRWTTP